MPRGSTMPLYVLNKTYSLINSDTQLQTNNHMSSNFLIESDNDLYSPVPAYTFLWQFY